MAKAREELGREAEARRLKGVQALRDMVRKECPNLSTSLEDASSCCAFFPPRRKFDYDRASSCSSTTTAAGEAGPKSSNNLRPSA